MPAVFLSTSDVKALTGATQATILAAIRRGALPAVRVGGSWVLNRTDSLAWAKDRRPNERRGRPPRLPQVVGATTEDCGTVGKAAL
jgi:excisionase family DNA binding protein